MHLEGSCHCGAVRFSLESAHPYPFNLCYCSICRKTAGGAGFAINLGGSHESLSVEGEESLRVYQAMVQYPGEERPHRSPAKRHFCGLCGSHLGLWDPRWPDLVHPLASAIDTPLPIPARAHPSPARFQGALGGRPRRSAGPAPRAVPGGVHRPVARSAGPRALSLAG